MNSSVLYLSLKNVNSISPFFALPHKYNRYMTSFDRTTTNYLINNFIILKSNFNLQVTNSRFSNHLNSVINLMKEDIEWEAFDKTLKQRSNDDFFNIKNCKFNNCTTEGSGSAIFVINDKVDMSVTNSYFSNCKAKIKGGAIFAKVDKLKLQENCFYRCRSGVDNGNDGSTLYSEVQTVNSIDKASCVECPEIGNKCWYGILMQWYGVISSKFINISNCHCEYVSGLGICDPKYSTVMYYVCYGGFEGNCLSFINMNTNSEYRYAHIINNDVKSGLIYFQNSSTTVHEFIFKNNKGPLTYSCVGKSTGIFMNCIFDKEYDQGIGFNATINCDIIDENKLVVTDYPGMLKMEIQNDNQYSEGYNILYIKYSTPLLVSIFVFICYYASIKRNKQRPIQAFL